MTVDSDFEGFIVQEGEDCANVDHFFKKLYADFPEFDLTKKTISDEKLDRYCDKIKLEEIDIKEEHFNLESIEKFDSIFSQFDEQVSDEMDIKQENYFLGFDNENNIQEPYPACKNLHTLHMDNRIVKAETTMPLNETSPVCNPCSPSSPNRRSGRLTKSLKATSQVIHSLHLHRKGRTRLQKQINQLTTSDRTLKQFQKPIQPNIKRHRRVNCGECEGCIKPSCRICVYCKDRFLKINRLKQRCVERKCQQFKLCNAAVCYICKSKSLKNFKSLYGESEVISVLMECSACFRVSHVPCQENLCNGREGRIIHSKPNCWQCPECAPFIEFNENESVSKEKKASERTVIAKNMQSKKCPEDQFQRAKSEGSSTGMFMGFNCCDSTRNPLIKRLKEQSYKGFRELTGRRPWTAYLVFVSMCSKTIRDNSPDGFRNHLTIGKSLGLEWHQLPERKKLVFREGARKINLILLRNANNISKKHKKKLSLDSTLKRNHKNEFLNKDNGKAFQCPKCETIFTKRNEFTLHFQKIHKNAVKKRKSVT